MVSTSINKLPAAPIQGEKPKKFLDTDFKRWQQKILSYLTTMNLARFLKENCPTMSENKTNNERRIAYDAWNHTDFLYKNYILNRLNNALYNVYCTVKTTKELWESLEKKYKTKDVSIKKFIVVRFLNFKIVDSKTVMEQVQELKLILHDIYAEGLPLSESFQVAIVIEKLLPMWKDLKNYLKHKWKEIGLKDLIMRLSIEEDNRKSQSKLEKVPMEPKASMVEQNTSKKKSTRGIKTGKKIIKPTPVCECIYSLDWTVAKIENSIYRNQI